MRPALRAGLPLLRTTAVYRRKHACSAEPCGLAVFAAPCIYLFCTLHVCQDSTEHTAACASALVLPMGLHHKGHRVYGAPLPANFMCAHV